MPLANVAVVTAGAGMTVTITEAVLLVSATEVAVSVADRAAVNGLGALYVTAVVVLFVSVPHAVPVQPVPEVAATATVQVTPWLPPSFDTDAVKVFVCPTSMVCVAAGEIATAIMGVSGVSPWPHPDSTSTAHTASITAKFLMGSSLSCVSTFLPLATRALRSACLSRIYFGDKDGGTPGERATIASSSRGTREPVIRCA